MSPAGVNNQRKHGALSKKDKVPKAAHFTGAGDLRAANGSFSVELEAFQAAMSKLANRFDDFTDEVNSAPELAAALPAGSGPVADTLGPAFRHRLGSDGGMDYAIRVNMDQLNKILDALRTTMDNYTRVEQETTDAIAGGQL